MTDTTAQLLESMATAWLLLARDTYDPDTQTAQWMTGNTPQPREDTSERQKNSVADPVWSAFADERRLALRARVQDAEKTLAATTAQLKAAEAKLRAALDAE